MKRITMLALTSVLLTLASCKKDVKINLDVPDAASYKKLYMPQASYNPINNAISISDKDTVFTYSAYLGGPLPATTDIAVNFSVLPEKVNTFNTQNGTSYKIMPAGSYKLESASAVIPANSQTTGKLKLTVKTKGFINPFETYLLPVTLKSNTEGVPLNDNISTTYYLFTGSYAQGQVPRDKVYSFGATPGTIFTNFYNNDLVRVDPSNGNLLRYPVDANGRFGTPAVIGSGWDVFNLVMFYGGNRLIGRKITNGNLMNYDINSDNSISGSREIGFGWNIFTMVIPFKETLLGINSAGAMTMYPLNASGGFGAAKSIGAGWNVFTQIIPYQNSLLTIEANGTMWQYPLSDDGVFGSRIKVGTGWNMYSSVIVSGTDLLGLDSNGDLWRYKFNPTGLWPL